MIGAIVLVAAVVVVLPMVLDSEPGPASREISVRIPSPDSGVFTSKVVPLPAAPATDKASAGKAERVPAKVAAEVAKPVPAPVAPAPSAHVAPAAAPPAPVEKPVAQTPPAKAPAAKPPATAKPDQPAPQPPEGQFVVQVIALADAAKAKKMQQDIAAAGIQSYTEVVSTAKGDVTRVRAGPYSTRAAAEKAREQLKALGLSGNVAQK